MLVVVLVLVAILALAGLRFVMQLSDENRAVYLGGDQVQAEALLASGETAIMAMLKKSPEERETEGGLLDNPSWFQEIGVTGDEQSDTSWPFFRSSRPRSSRAGSAEFVTGSPTSRLV